MDEEVKTPDEAKAEEVKKEVKEEVKEEVKPESFSQEEFVSKNKYNQALRKMREMELEKIELAKRVVATTPLPTTPVQAVVPAAPKETPEKDFWEEEEDKKTVPTPAINEEVVARLVEEKIKPIYDAQKNAFETQKKNDRAAFFAKYPKYLESSEEFISLMEVLDKNINPKADASYLEQLEMARILHEANNTDNPTAETFKKEIVTEAGNVTPSKLPQEKEGAFTAEEKKIMKDFGVSEEGMKAYKRKIKSGEMVILGLQ